MFDDNNLNNAWSVRTDLAYDSVKNYDKEIPGLIKTEKNQNGIKYSRYSIDSSASQILNKKAGIYYTIDFSDVSLHEPRVGNEIEKIFSTSLQSFLLEKGLLKKRVLIVGLGNINVTPDALGPYVLDHILVTRHMFEKKKLTGDFSSVAALAPGVMGTTGLETFDIVQSLLKKIDVDYLMVIDALASSSLERVNKTIQMTDTGIRPGSGVGASRKEFSQDTLGIPVIAIGVPTVVDAVTITSGVIDYVIKYISKKSLKTNVEVEEVKAPESIKERMFGEVGLLDEQEKQALLREALSPTGINMMVTPKEIDEDVEELARLMASSINGVLHPSLRA